MRPVAQACSQGSPVVHLRPFQWLCALRQGPRALLMSPIEGSSVQLKSGALGWANVAGLGIAIAISGQFSGWNFGLAGGGWGGILAAAVLTADSYLGYTPCVAALAAAMRTGGRLETSWRRAFGVSGGYVGGMSVLSALALAIGVVANFTAGYGTSVLGLN